MRSLLAIAALEARGRWWLLLAALPLSAAAMFLRPGDARLLAAAYGSLCAAAAGARLFAPDLVSGRVVFHLTAPVKSSTIYLGKLVGELAPIASGVTLVSLPAALRAPAGDAARDLGWALGATLVVLLAANVVSIALATRTGWLVVDAGAAAATAVLIAVACRGPARAGPAPALVAGCVPGVACFLAGLAALSVGRTNPLRAHGALSLTLWSCLVPAAAALLFMAR